MTVPYVKSFKLDVTCYPDTEEVFMKVYPLGKMKFKKKEKAKPVPKPEPREIKVNAITEVIL